MALLLTFLVAGVLWVFSVATLEAVALDLRAGQRSIEAVRLFHLSDAALRMCETHIANSRAHTPRDQTSNNHNAGLAMDENGSTPEPERWRRTGALLSGAPGVIDVVMPWRGRSLTVPCLAERWLTRTDAQLWLLTVRSPSSVDSEQPMSHEAGIWLQSAIEVGETVRKRWWRSVAEPPV